MEKHAKQMTGRGRYISSLLVYSDLIIINLLFALTTLWICRSDFTLFSTSEMRTLWVLVNVSYIPSAIWNSSRSGGHRIILLDHVLLHSLQVVMIHALFFITLNVFVDNSQFPLEAYLVFYGMAIVIVPLWWVMSRMFIKSYRRHGRNFTRVVIVGTNSTARRLIQEMKSDMGFGYFIMGVFDEKEPEDFPAKYLGSIDGLEEYIKENDVKEVYFTQSGAQEQDLIKVIDITDRLMVKFFYVPRISRIICRGFELNTIGAVPVLTTLRNPLKNYINRGLKRSFDIAFSGLVLVFFPLVLIPVAIAIKISSPGPIFFKQERTGYRGKSFKCYKFRTMKVNDNADKLQATKDDPRKTKVGEFLRHTSIDELPQFINVFIGDMSVVGPRPHMLKHTEEYSRIVDKYMVRHAVKPGITGWAQVNGYRGLTDELWKMERRVEFDVWYIENWTFLLDIRIIFRTLFNAASGEDNAF